jgi:phospholipid transport system transporter-binding protein
MNQATIAYQPDSIRVSGILDFAGAAALWKDSLTKLGGYPALQFDLSGVTASNSGGVALLLQWLKYAKQHQKVIDFQHIPASLASILAVSGVASLLSESVRS